jgi:hypothetical protein
VIRAGSAQLHPAVPGASSVAALAANERVLILSSTAFDALPAALVEVLRELPPTFAGWWLSAAALGSSRRSTRTGSPTTAPCRRTSTRPT